MMSNSDKLCSKFGSHFRRIADLLNVETSLATFEDRLIYLDKKELIGFVDTLGRKYSVFLEYL